MRFSMGRDMTNRMIPVLGAMKVHHAIQATEGRPSAATAVRVKFLLG
jgi:hypothetical protein